MFDLDPRKLSKVRFVRKNKNGTFSVVQQRAFAFLGTPNKVIGTFQSKTSAYAHIGRLTVDEQTKG